MTILLVQSFAFFAVLSPAAVIPSILDPWPLPPLGVRDRTENETCKAREMAGKMELNRNREERFLHLHHEGRHGT